jgi:hypothetical protein
MSDRAQSEEIKPLKNGALPGFALWIDSYNAALASWAESGKSMLKKAAELSDDIISFSRTRLQSDLDSWQAVTSCRNAKELLDWQQQFTQTATSQYLDQTRKVASRMVTLIADAATAPLQEQTPNSAT